MVPSSTRSATTTEAVRRAIRRGEESVTAFAWRHGISPTTVQKWRKRVHTADAAMGPMAIHSTVLAAGEEAVVVAFRCHTPLPLDDCLYALQATIPNPNCLVVDVDAALKQQVLYLRSGSGNRTYLITTRRISGAVLNRRNGEEGRACDLQLICSRQQLPHWSDRALLRPTLAWCGCIHIRCVLFHMICHIPRRWGQREHYGQNCHRHEPT